MVLQVLGNLLKVCQRLLQLGWHSLEDLENRRTRAHGFLGHGPDRDGLWLVEWKRQLGPRRLLVGIPFGNGSHGVGSRGTFQALVLVCMRVQVRSDLY